MPVTPGFTVRKDELIRFLGVVNRCNVTRPPRIPEVVPEGKMTRLVISQGLLQMIIEGRTVDNVAPLNLRISKEEYDNLAPLIANGLIEFLHLGGGGQQITEMLRANGLVIDTSQEPYRIQPLSLTSTTMDAF